MIGNYLHKHYYQPPTYHYHWPWSQIGDGWWIEWFPSDSLGSQTTSFVPNNHPCLKLDEALQSGQVFHDSSLGLFPMLHCFSSLKLHQHFRNSIILFLHEELSKTLSGLFGISWKVLQISAHRHAQTSKKADRRHWHVTVKGPGVPVPMSVKREWIVRAGRLLLVEPVTVWQGTAGETEFYNLGANRGEGERGNPARGQTWHRRAVEEQAFQARRPLNCLQFFYCYCQRFPGCHLRLLHRTLFR